MKQRIRQFGAVDRQAAEHLAGELGIKRLAAQVLVARGIKDPVAARDFLNTDLTRLRDPYALRDMDRAVARIRAALDAGEKIAVYGDYDVDGITATYLVTDCLRRMGANCTYYIPDRLDEGYGVNLTALVRLRAAGVRLVITVDTGITAVSEVAAAKTMGLDLVICDHHECKEELPAACAVINPHRRDCDYSFPALAGVGVAYKLLCALTNDNLTRYLPFVCMGTVADIMPLFDENRAIVAHGLRSLRETEHIGLSALLSAAGVKRESIDADTIGYLLAPRINAAGRMAAAGTVVELFLCEDEAVAQESAERLCALNRERQELEAKIMAEALAALPAVFEPGRDHAIVLAGEGWHHGVIGIVASRLVDRYHCPTLLFSLEGETAKGSGRSVAGFNLHGALTEISDCITQFGGHEMAVGLTAERKKIDELRARFTELAAVESDERPAVLPLDFAVETGDLTLPEVEGLAALEPFGAKFPKPMFALQNVALENVSPIGNGRHLKLVLNGMASVLFGRTEEQLSVSCGDRVDAAVQAEINTFRGRSVQLVIRDLRLEEKTYSICARVPAWRQGEMTSEEAAHLQMTRNDLGEVWRSIKAESQDGVWRGSVAKLARGLHGDACERALMALLVFEELALIELTLEQGMVTIAFTPEKRADIGASALLQHVNKLAGQDVAI